MIHWPRAAQLPHPILRRQIWEGDPRPSKSGHHPLLNLAVSKVSSRSNALYDRYATERRATLESSAFNELCTELTGKVRPEAVAACAKMVCNVRMRCRTYVGV